MKLILAPIRGVTDYIYRNAFHKYFGGLDSAMAPFIPTMKGDKIKESKLKDVMPANNEMPVIPQIIGKDPDDFILLANTLFDYGYKEINWNLGCPHKMVAKRKRGSGLLPHPELIDDFLEKVIPEIPNRLSLKIRLGRESTDEVFELVPVINKHKISELTIHARTGIQMYEGKPYVDVFEKCLPLIEHPVVYNGDINSIEDYQRLSERFPRLEKWMIGRGVLYNPFLAQKIKTQNKFNPDNKLELLQNFHDKVFNDSADILSGDTPLLGKMKEFWFYFSQAFTDSKKILKKVQKSKKAMTYKEIVREFFESKPEVVI